MQFATGGVPALHQVSVFSLINIAFEAGKAIMAIYAGHAENGQLHVATKADNSPVTEADLAAHAVILRGLNAITPDVPVVSEESYEEGHAPYPQTYWLVDPLDGTKEFMKASGEFTVNIALIHENAPVFGLVFAPALNECFIGGEGMGAFRYRNSEWAKIAPPSAPAARLRVIASKSHLCSATEKFIERLGSCDIVQAGSSLKFCRIATGEADIYPRMGPTSEWDTAAAQAVVEATGGKVHDLYGNRLMYGKSSIINPPFVVVSSLLGKDTYVQVG